MLLGVAKIVCVKRLTLVLPEPAQQYGIAAETPVFLSPYNYTVGPQRCSVCRCRVTYTPLVYQTGQTTRSQHWHRYDGGIYFDVVDSTYPLAWHILWPAHHTGWLAIVEPVGRMFWCTGHYRAEAVAVREIMAWCMGHYLADWCLINEAPVVHTVAEGALVADPLPCD
jgi:hypothetical protein